MFSKRNRFDIICTHLEDIPKRETLIAKYISHETIQNTCRWIIITVFSLFSYLLIRYRRGRLTCAIMDSRFCLLGKVVVDIHVRYSEASLTLVTGTTVLPKIVRAMTPRLYIPPVCARGGATEGGRRGLMPSEFARGITRRESTPSRAPRRARVLSFSPNYCKKSLFMRQKSFILRFICAVLSGIDNFVSVCKNAII